MKWLQRDVSLQPERGACPFGWSIACAGRKPAQVREEVRSLVDWAIATWTTYFPREHGYVLEVSSPAGPSNGVQLTVRRGDFRALVAIESTLDPHRKSRGQWAVRMFGRAESEAVARAERQGHALVQRFRTGGVVVGLLLFASFLWLSVGVHDPIFLLGGLLMVVTALLSTTALGSLGAWIGERLAEKIRLEARTATDGNVLFEQDLRRWRALVRHFSAQRDAITGSELTVPFRALPPASRDRDTSRPLSRLQSPTSSFSFSS